MFFILQLSRPSSMRSRTHRDFVYVLIYSVGLIDEEHVTFDFSRFF